MSTPAQIGKQEYNAALKKARDANQEARQWLRRIMSDSSSNLIRAQVGNVLLAMSLNDDAINRLDEIGETLKDSK